MASIVPEDHDYGPGRWQLPELATNWLVGVMANAHNSVECATCQPLSSMVAEEGVSRGQTPPRLYGIGPLFRGSLRWKYGALTKKGASAMNRRVLAFLSLLSLIFSIAGPAAASHRESASTGPDDLLQGASEGIFLIRLDEEPLATYRGGVRGLQATTPDLTGRRRLDVAAPDSVAYVDHLLANQTTFIGRMERAIGHDADVRFTYVHGNNGMAVWLTPSEAALVTKLPGVTSVQPDSVRELQTDTGPSWIGAPDIWGGTDCSVPGSCGEGIVVGIIDTGINPSNPSFADIGGDGYDHVNPNGAGDYKGVCDSTHTGTVEIKGYDATFPCNDKLIGAWGYASVDLATGANSPIDYDGHGSHTASTTAGNFVEATIGGAARADELIDISGVAPHANIIAYAGCCTVSALTASIDQAIADGVDVINYSIGSTVASDLWNEFDAVAFLNAREAGIFVATSAGNQGPMAATVGSPADAPWLISVAASTHSRTWINQVSFSGGAAALAPIGGAGFTDGHGPVPIVYAGEFGDALCRIPFAAGTWTNDEIVVCDRGQVARLAKGANVADGGAGGMILANAEADALSINADAHTIPASHITYPDGVALKTWLASGTGHMGTLTAGVYVQDDARADVVASFSSRGENRVIDTLAPHIAAPGVDIIAASGQNDATLWAFDSGTSMASPHVAGAGALLMQQHPDWTPAEVQSALMLTAGTDMVDSDEVTPATPFAMGNGVVVLSNASNAGLVMGETTANYLAAEPAIGGDPTTLNLANMANSQCALECTWERTVTATSAGTWTITATASAGVALSVTPTSLTLAPDESATITVTAGTIGAPINTWAFGEVALTAAGVPDSHMPVAVKTSAETATLWATDVLSSSLTLRWDALSIPGVAGYAIFQDGVAVANIPVPTTRYAVSGLAPLTDYQFTLKALDAPGNALAGQTVDVTTAIDFVDDDSSIFEDDIERLYSSGITKGCNPPLNDRYCPEGTLTRGQLAAMLARGFDLPATSEDFFTDDEDSVFESDINRVAAARITLGCNPPTNDNFCPDVATTRGEVAAMFDRALSLATATTDYFTDDSDNIFEDSINRLARAGITKGCNPPANDNYCPDGLVTRGQMAAFFHRALS